MDLYRERIESRSGSAKATAEARLQDQLERTFRLAGIKAERAAVVDHVRDRRIGSVTAQKLIRELDLLETRYRV